MSIGIDEYVRTIATISPVAPVTTATPVEAVAQQEAENPEQIAEVAEPDMDSYIPSMNNTNEPIPCENYNDILKVMQSAKAAEGGMDFTNQR